MFYSYNIDWSQRVRLDPGVSRFVVLFEFNWWIVQWWHGRLTFYHYRRLFEGSGFDYQVCDVITQCKMGSWQPTAHLLCRCCWKWFCSWSFSLFYPQENALKIMAKFPLRTSQTRLFESHCHQQIIGIITSNKRTILYFEIPTR